MGWAQCESMKRWEGEKEEGKEKEKKEKEKN